MGLTLEQVAEASLPFFGLEHGPTQTCNRPFLPVASWWLSSVLGPSLQLCQTVQKVSSVICCNRPLLLVEITQICTSKRNTVNGFTQKLLNTDISCIFLNKCLFVNLMYVLLFLLKALTDKNNTEFFKLIYFLHLGVAPCWSGLVSCLCSQNKRISSCKPGVIPKQVLNKGFYYVNACCALPREQVRSVYDLARLRCPKI